MLIRLLLLLILVPLVELVLLLWLGRLTDTVWVPVATVIVTGVAGSWLARQQGYAVYRQMQDELSAGRMPTDAMIDGVLIFIAGILLVTPGVLTDVVGITIFLPPIRRFYRRQVIAWFKRTFRLESFVLPRPPGDSSQVLDSYVVDPEAEDKNKYLDS